MPILTLALQESFPKSELGVVTSSSQFFRQIGGTFGMTILGAIMNHKSTVLLEQNLEPVVKQLPVEASELANTNDGYDSYESTSLIFFLTKSRDVGQNAKRIRRAHAASTEKCACYFTSSSVYLGLVFVLLGAVLTLFIGNIKVSDRKSKK